MTNIINHGIKKSLLNYHVAKLDLNQLKYACILIVRIDVDAKN